MPNRVGVAALALGIASALALIGTFVLIGLSQGIGSTPSNPWAGLGFFVGTLFIGIPLTVLLGVGGAITGLVALNRTDRRKALGLIGLVLSVLPLLVILYALFQYIFLTGS